MNDRSPDITPKVLGTMPERIAFLRAERERIAIGGGQDRIDKQHAMGRLTARERIEALLDPDTFQERDPFAEHRCTLFGMAGKQLPGDGVVTGFGLVDGRQVFLASQDFTVAGGAAGEVHCDKIVSMMELSLKTGSPFVFINDSGGARIQEGIDALAAYGRIFYHNTLLSGVVPQISLICGPCAGGAAYAPALTDFIIQTRQAQMFITGPSVIKQVTGQSVTAEELGGVRAHMYYSGVVHFIAEDGHDATRICRRLLGFLPPNNMSDPPEIPAERGVAIDEAMNAVLPENPRAVYDMRTIARRILDHGDYMEIQDHYAPNITIGFGRVLGRTVGVVANNPMHRGGVLDIDSSDKAARFIRFCNAFNIPILTLVDVPGFMPGVEQEYGGIIRHGAKLLFAYSAATVPKITIIVRKAFGGAYVAMASKDLGADAVAAWPTADIAVMGPEAAIEVIFRKEITEAENPEAKRREMLELYRSTFSSPYVAARRRMVDQVIEPAETRLYVARMLESLRTKRDHRPHKKHGLTPL